MTKRILIVLELCLIPLAAFADIDFGLGAAAFYNSPVLIGQDVDVSGWKTNGFTFGGHLRFKWSLLQLEALGLYTIKDDIKALDLYGDVGLALDLWILRLSLGGGPNFTYGCGGAMSDMLGWNIKANADIKLGRISLGLSYITGLVVDDGIAWDKSTGMLGASVLFWL